MMSCRDVAEMLSTGEMDQAPFRSRVAVWMHLAMCRHCRAFRDQLRRLATRARSTARSLENEPPRSFEAGIVEQLKNR